jgi:hypothetical protein
MGADAHTTVGALRQAVAAFVDARDWQPFHRVKNLYVCQTKSDPLDNRKMYHLTPLTVL